MKQMIWLIFVGLFAMPGTSPAQKYDCSQCPSSTVPYQACVPGNEAELNQCFQDLNTVWYHAICLQQGAVYSLNAPLPLVQNTTLTLCGAGAVIERDKNESPDPFRLLKVRNATMYIEETTFFNGRPAVLNDGSALVTIENSTFAHSMPALRVKQQNTLEVYNSTFTDNFRAIEQLSYSATNIYNSTFSNTKGDLLINSRNSTMTVASSILEGACSGAVTSEGANVSTECALSNLQSNDIAGIFDAGLGDRLWYNGGPTPTLSLERGSPAIGNGSCFLEGADQRGVVRETPCDSGAFEAICAASTIEDRILKIDLFADFVNPGGSAYSPESSYALLNDGSCELETIYTEEPDKVDQVEWYLKAFNGRPEPDDEFAIYNIYFTESRIPSHSESCPGSVPAPSANTCPEERGISCINNCLASGASSAGLATYNPEIPLYTMDVDLQIRNWKCPSLLPDPKNCPNPSDLNPSNEPCYTLPWSYTAQWNDKINNGNWDPRMRAVLPPDG